MTPVKLAIALREAVATLHGADQVGAVLIHADGGHLDAEAAAIARAVATAESAEAIDAFLTKRTPDFTRSPR